MASSSFQAIGVALLATTAWGAGWTEYSSGPLRIITDAGERPAKTQLAELDQLRHTLAAYLGKDELNAVWPIEIVLFSKQSDYGAHALPRPLVEGPDSMLGAWSADTALPHDLLREITRQLIESNAGRMPDAIEQALCDLMATIQTDKKGVMTIGNAPTADELPPERRRAWAKLDMLAALPEYSRSLRVYFSNLQQGGDEDLAAHNAFNVNAAELNKRADAYLTSGQFMAVSPSGAPINPQRDFSDSRIPDAGLVALFAALKAAGSEFPPESPRGLLKSGTREDLELAVKANPRWAAPHAALAAFHGDSAGKAVELKLAATLEPRKSSYWAQLAQVQEDDGKYDDADKSWKFAERNAVNEEERAKLHEERLGLEGRQAQAAIEDRKHKISDAADDLERVKKEAEARIHAAEDAANKRNGALAPGTKVVEWWNDQDGQKLSGSLTNVECLTAGPLRLTIQPASGAAVKLLIRDMQSLALKGADRVQFSCGVQKPAKPINLVHDGMPDAKQGTAGNIRTVELP